SFASVTPAAIETTRCFGLINVRTSAITLDMTCGLTARIKMSLSTTTSRLLGTAFHPLRCVKLDRASGDGSPANPSSTAPTPALVQQRDNALAICPAPRNPMRIRAGSAMGNACAKAVRDLLFALCSLLFAHPQVTSPGSNGCGRRACLGNTRTPKPYWPLLW